MYPDIVTPDINPVQAAGIAATNGHIVDLSIAASVHSEVEGRRIHQYEVVNGEILYLVKSENAGACDIVVDMIQIARALHGTRRMAAEELEVVCMLDVDHIAT